MAQFMRRLDSLARDHTEKAVDTIANIMDDPFAEDRDRLAAAKEILDRGHGKPLTATIALPASRQQAAALAAMADEELMAAIEQAQLPRLTRQPVTIVQERDPLLD
jgi:class 3 adenylate cyclase